MGNSIVKHGLRKIRRFCKAQNEKLAYKLGAFKFNMFDNLRIMSPTETVRYIIKNKCSVARYGDGEFWLINGGAGPHFQRNTEGLGEALNSVLTKDASNLLICVPGVINSVAGQKEKPRKYWKEHFYENGNGSTIVKNLRKRCGRRYLFGDALFSRPYVDWESAKLADEIFPLVKSLWQDKEVIIIEGEKSRLGVGNDLFDNMKSIKRILCPAENAFLSRQNILDAVCTNYNGELVLLALGPTATVLASDLSKMGIWAIDIGHIDAEYEWYKMGATEKVALKQKYINEVYDGWEVDDCNDYEYQSQIITRVDC